MSQKNDSSHMARCWRCLSRLQSNDQHYKVRLVKEKIYLRWYWWPPKIMNRKFIFLNLTDTGQLFRTCTCSTWRSANLRSSTASMESSCPVLIRWLIEMYYVCNIFHSTCWSNTLVVLEIASTVLYVYLSNSPASDGCFIITISLLPNRHRVPSLLR